MFGISIIQGRLQDMNGVPVVGICETPFTGTNDLVKRASDIVLAALILVLISRNMSDNRRASERRKFRSMSGYRPLDMDSESAPPPASAH